MKIFGAQPLRADIGVVRCADCDKPILRSAVSEHISMSWLSTTDRYLAHAQPGNCNDIRSGRKWVKGKTADSEGTVS
jgi:SAGA-associated factor 73